MIGFEWRPDLVYQPLKCEKFDINGKRGWIRTWFGVRFFWCDTNASDRIAELLPAVAKADMDAKVQAAGVRIETTE